MNTQDTKQPSIQPAPRSEIFCKLVGADMDERTITVELPHGMTPSGLALGQPIFVVYPFQKPQVGVALEHPTLEECDCCGDTFPLNKMHVDGHQILYHRVRFRGITVHK